MYTQNLKHLEQYPHHRRYRWGKHSDPGAYVCRRLFRAMRASRSAFSACIGTLGYLVG